MRRRDRKREIEREIDKRRKCTLIFLTILINLWNNLKLFFRSNDKRSFLFVYMWCTHSTQFYSARFIFICFSWSMLGCVFSVCVCLCALSSLLGCVFWVCMCVCLRVYVHFPVCVGVCFEFACLCVCSLSSLLGCVF